MLLDFHVSLCRLLCAVVLRPNHKPAWSQVVWEDCNKHAQWATNLQTNYLYLQALSRNSPGVFLQQATFSPISELSSSHYYPKAGVINEQGQLGLRKWSWSSNNQEGGGSIPGSLTKHFAPTWEHTVTGEELNLIHLQGLAVLLILDARAYLFYYYAYCLVYC